MLFKINKILRILTYSKLFTPEVPLMIVLVLYLVKVVGGLEN